MTEHNLFYYPYMSVTNAQLPLLKVAAPRVGVWDSYLLVISRIDSTITLLVRNQA